MAEYVSVAEARKQIRDADCPGPGHSRPVGRGDSRHSGREEIPYTRGLFEIGSDHADLIAWTAQASAPAIAWNDELPKSNWAEQLYLAERIQPEPALIPAIKPTGSKCLATQVNYAACAVLAGVGA